MPDEARSSPAAVRLSDLARLEAPPALALHARRSPPGAGDPFAGRHTVDIRPAPGWSGVNLRELWAYRELFLFLVWRDVKVRYAQTVLGAGWVVLQPLITVVLFTVVFGGLAGIPSDGAPYAAFSLAALVPWGYFSGALTASSGSLVSSTNLITKVYFPRLVIPFASVLGGLVNLAVTLVLLMVTLLAFGIVPRISAVAVVPVLVLIMMAAAGGVGCWLGALAIQYRDVSGVSAFLVQAWMYLSPVVYPLSVVPDGYRTLYSLNPMVGVIEGFRSAMLGVTPLPRTAIGLAAVVSFVLLVTGVRYFRHVEHTFADVA